MYMAQCQGPRAQMVKRFWYLPIFGRKMLRKSPKCQGPRACNQLLYHFSEGTIHLHLASFNRDKILLKNRLARGNVH